MGGGKGSSGVSPAVQNSELDANSALTQIAQSQNQRGGQLFDASFPGFEKAENFYSTLSTGDPYAISRAIAPAAQQITQAADASKAQILRTGAPGGEKNLAIENVDVNRGAQIGSTASSGYLNSFNALAQLAGQGVNQSISSVGTGIGAYQAGTQAIGQLGNQQLQAQQLNAEEKGSTFGSLAGLGGSVAGAAGEAGSFGALFAGI
jgi:hypothetical protein